MYSCRFQDLVFAGFVMLLDVLFHIFSLDVSWLFAFVFGHIEWLFILACLGYFIYQKNPIAGAVFVAFYLYATFDLANALQWVFQKGFFWAPIIVFLSLFFLDSFFLKRTGYSANRGVFAGVIFYLSLMFINLVL